MYYSVLVICIFRVVPPHHQNESHPLYPRPFIFCSEEEQIDISLLAALQVSYLYLVDPAAAAYLSRPSMRLEEPGSDWSP